MADPTSELWLPGPKRFRILQACITCRKRKTKCDGARPRCGSCISRRARCSWPVTAESAFASSELRDGSPDQNGSHQPQTASLGHRSFTPDEYRAESTSSFDPLKEALEIFYGRFHHTIFCSFFHVPSYDASFIQQQSPFLAHAILGLSSPCFGIDTTRAVGFRAATEMSAWHSARAKHLSRESLESASVMQIQANLILAFRELLFGSSTSAWSYTGIAIRKAQLLRLGREYHSRVASRQKEIQRRTYWACFVMDRLVSYSCWRPQSIDFDCIRLNLPSPESSFTFDESFESPKIDQLPLPCDFSRLGVLPYYIAAVHLWAQAAYVQMKGGRRYNKEQPDERDTVSRCLQDRIRDLHDAIPPAMLWSEHNRKAFRHTKQEDLFTSFHFLLNHARCLSPQEYLPYDTSFNLCQLNGLVPSQQDSTAQLVLTCLTVSENIVNQAVDLFRDGVAGRMVLQSPFVAPALLTAANIQLWLRYMTTPNGDNHEAVDKKLQELRKIIESWRLEWPTAESWLETLDLLEQVYETINYNAGSQPPSPETQTRRRTASITDGPLASSTEKSVDPPSVALTEGRGLPELREKMVDKIRFILLSSLEDSEARKRVLAASIITSAQESEQNPTPSVTFDYWLSEDIDFGFPDFNIENQLSNFMD